MGGPGRSQAIAVPAPPLGRAAGARTGVSTGRAPRHRRRRTSSSGHASSADSPTMSPSYPATECPRSDAPPPGGRPSLRREASRREGRRPTRGGQRVAPALEERQRHPPFGVDKCHPGNLLLGQAQRAREDAVRSSPMSLSVSIHATVHCPRRSRSLWWFRRCRRRWAAGMVPSLAKASAREQDGLGVQGLVIQDRIENDRTPRAVASRFESDSPIRGAITWTQAPRLKTDARCQYDLAGGAGRSVSRHRLPSREAQRGECHRQLTELLLETSRASDEAPEFQPRPLESSLASIPGRRRVVPREVCGPAAAEPRGGQEQHSPGELAPRGALDDTNRQDMRWRRGAGRRGTSGQSPTIIRESV